MRTCIFKYYSKALIVLVILLSPVFNTSAQDTLILHGGQKQIVEISKITSNHLHYYKYYEIPQNLKSVHKSKVERIITKFDLFYKQRNVKIFTDTAIHKGRLVGISPKALRYKKGDFISEVDINTIRSIKTQNGTAVAVSFAGGGFGGMFIGMIAFTSVVAYNGTATVVSFGAVPYNEPNPTGYLLGGLVIGALVGGGTALAIRSNHQVNYSYDALKVNFNKFRKKPRDWQDIIEVVGVKD